MPNYSGVWNLVSQLQAYAAQNWPQGPGAPTSVSATAGDAQATITFTAPTFTGIPPGVTGYLATSSPGGLTATGAASPLTVTGLTNGTAYTFNVQATNGVQYGPAGTSGSVTPAGPRGLFGGGTSSATYRNVIDYITISSAGNATDFGDLTLSRSLLASCSSSTRGCFGGGDTASGSSNVIDYVTIASTGNATDFGDLIDLSGFGSQLMLSAACSSSTRGLFGGGVGPLDTRINAIQYITIASVGNSTDFGDLTVIVSRLGACSSATRGIFLGGYNQDNQEINVIGYVTIATTGNATDFGDINPKCFLLASCSSSTRGLSGGGFAVGVGTTSLVQYITIASTGNATNFGDLTTARNTLAACSSELRGVFGGGTTGTDSNVIDYVTIASTGNATDFGDLTLGRSGLSGCSNAHGGL